MVGKGGEEDEEVGEREGEQVEGWEEEEQEEDDDEADRA